MVQAVVGIFYNDGSFIIPAARELSPALGAVSTYGIRNEKAAKSWLYDGRVCIVFASSETAGVAEYARCPDYIGQLPKFEEALRSVEEEFLIRNGLTQTQNRGTHFVPISRLNPGEINSPSRDGEPLTQPESDLIHRYQDFIGRDLKKATVRHPGSRVSLFIDAFDEEVKCLIEAKSSARRTLVLQAIAQLLDYGRLVPEHERKMILLPEEPEPDLVELAYSVNIAVCFEKNGNFVIRNGAL